MTPDEILDFLEQYVKSRYLGQQVTKVGNKIHVSGSKEEDYSYLEPLPATPPQHTLPLVLVCLHTPANMTTLMDHWASFVPDAHLKLMFINPFSSMDKRWIINPHVHDLVCERSMLKQGLSSLASNVDLYGTSGSRIKVEERKEQEEELEEDMVEDEEGMEGEEV
ncbi:hypothetical protein HZB02_03915 [Candidatus Woesearchaeota archaeon]|nr:hypothetical protein [Candidatus Woesearchaeota archaeon]